MAAAAPWPTGGSATGPGVDGGFEGASTDGAAGSSTTGFAAASAAARRAASRACRAAAAARRRCSAATSRESSPSTRSTISRCSSTAACAALRFCVDRSLRLGRGLLGLAEGGGVGLRLGLRDPQGVEQILAVADGGGRVALAAADLVAVLGVEHLGRAAARVAEHVRVDRVVRDVGLALAEGRARCRPPGPWPQPPWPGPRRARGGRRCTARPGSRRPPGASPGGRRPSRPRPACR